MESRSEGRLHLDIVTPEALVVSEVVDEVTAQGMEGDFGVLPGHITFLTALRPGPLVYRMGETTRRVELAGGIVEVLDDRVTVLATALSSAD
ncbi:MAG: ATP synthase F1 subunit epsilon [Nitrospirota bacterium]